MASPLAPRIKDKVIGPGKLKGVSKSPWERKVRKRSRKPEKSKRAKDAQKEMNGTKEPTSNVIQNLNDQIESLREE